MKTKTDSRQYYHKAWSSDLLLESRHMENRVLRELNELLHSYSPPVSSVQCKYVCEVND